MYLGTALANQSVATRNDGYEDGLREGRRILRAPVRGSWGTPPAEVLRDAIADWSSADECEEPCGEEYAARFVEGLKAAEREGNDE